MTGEFPMPLAAGARNGGPALPEPVRERWQPLRAGLVDLFFYDVEEFWFRDGHLLLRGNNGTGKSKVLALLLPFLLDGEVAPHRVEPDGDPSKRMEWNLLLGGRYTERIGYTWLELGRLEPDGAARYLTLGCGLKAVAGRGAPARWFFLTDQRVGVDLWLATPAGTAKTKDRLAPALEGRGTLVEQPSAWRRLLDERLFGLGGDRYEALLTLLVQLRQPQLSKRPDERALSAALTEALPPLDQAVVADVADAFRNLEADRIDLQRVAEAHAAVTEFRDRYRRYAGVATRRRAETVRKAQSGYESTTRKLTTASEQLREARAAEAGATRQLADLEVELARHRGAEQALRESPAMRQAATLDEIRKAAGTAEQVATEAARRAREAAADAEAAEQARAAAEEAAALTRTALEAATATADEAAASAGLAAPHREALAMLRSDGVSAAEAAAGSAAVRRERDARHVLGLAEAVADAARELAGSRRRRDEAASSRDAAAERRAEQAGAVEAAGAAHVAAVTGWAQGCTELAGAVDDGVLGRLAGWVVSLDGPNPAWDAAERAARDTDRRLASEELRLEAGRDGLEREQADLAAERERLAAGEAERPPVPPTRATPRDGRPGAPLWQVVDFADHLDGDARAGLEAALEASGLLDAWVTPQGHLLDPATLDTFVRADPPAAASLAAVLRPAIDADDPAARDLTEGAVAAVLAGIGLDGAPAGRGDEPASWVAADGRWRLGAARGRWTKAAARYVGHAAREAARAARLAEIDTELRRLAVERERLTGALDAVAARRQRVDEEWEARPADTPLREATQRLAVLTEEVVRLEERVAEHERAVERAARTHAGAVQTCDEAAADLRVPSVRDELEALLAALADYRQALARLWPTAARHRDASRHHEVAAAAAGQRRGHADRAASESDHARREANDARTRHDELRASVGADVAELERRLEEVGRALKAAQARHRDVDRQRAEAHDGAVRAGTEQRLLAEQLDAATGQRREATEAFQRFAATGLLAAGVPGLDLPDPEQPWAPDPTVRLARRVDQALEGLDASDAVWDRLQRTVTEQFQALAEALSRHGHHASAELGDAGFVVSIAYQQRQTSPEELVSILADDLAHREQLLSARERELLENHLVADVATHLQELIAAADAQVDAVNAELAARPTSTGMRLRLVWRPRADGPTGLPEARRRLLRQDADAWSGEDREAVGAFLQAQIADVRAAGEGGTWPEHLGEALDYRRWHTFAVERYQDGAWRPASGPASGGERALVVTLPLFAAASSFYATAGNRHAPRLVLLDEAFAGIDDDARAKCMGLLAEFDLDFVMTSEREWGCYPTVPGLGISQLARRDGIDAVHVSRWEWDGRERRRVDIGSPPLREPEPAGP